MQLAPEGRESKVADFEIKKSTNAKRMNTTNMILINFITN
jgi:hypothetical protein